MNSAANFRTELRDHLQEPMLCPVVWDAHSTKIAAHAGFKAVWLGGAPVTLNQLGVADGGIVSVTEMEIALRQCVAACDVPILADIDAGFGNYLNAMRSVRLMEAAGAVGVQIDDQQSHRSPYQNSTIVVPVEEAVGKVKAAVDARKDENFLIVARTDVLWTEGINAAIDRANLFAEAGAECQFISGAITREFMGKVRDEVRSPHLQMTHVPSAMNLEEIRKYGFDFLALGQADPLRAATMAMWHYYHDLHDRKLDAYNDFVETLKGTPFEDWAEYTGMKAFKELDRRYASPDEYARRYDLSRRFSAPPPVRKI